MVRVITQLLIGMMLFFGVVTIAPRLAFHLKGGNIARSLYFLVICFTMLFFSVLSFYFAYSGLTE